MSKMSVAVRVFSAVVVGAALLASVPRALADDISSEDPIVSILSKSVGGVTATNTSCGGGADPCITNGGVAFSLTSLLNGSVPAPVDNNAASFEILVGNDTGSAEGNFTLYLTANFSANGGNGWPFSCGMSNFNYSCTVTPTMAGPLGTTNEDVHWAFSGGSIASGAFFDIRVQSLECGTVGNGSFSGTGPGDVNVVSPYGGCTTPPPPAVPEPSTSTMLGTGLLGLLGLARRRLGI